VFRQAVRLSGTALENGLLAGSEEFLQRFAAGDQDRRSGDAWTVREPDGWTRALRSLAVSESSQILVEGQDARVAFVGDRADKAVV